MKRLFLLIETPDCFQPNTDTVEIHLKGAPENSYITAQIIDPRFTDNGDDLNNDFKTGGDV